MLLSVVISLATIEASQIVKETEQPETYKANTAYTLGRQSESSCDHFDLTVEGGKWECDTFDEHGECELKCTAGKVSIITIRRFIFFRRFETRTTKM